MINRKLTPQEQLVLTWTVGSRIWALIWWLGTVPTAIKLRSHML